MYRVIIAVATVLALMLAACGQTAQSDEAGTDASQSAVASTATEPSQAPESDDASGGDGGDGDSDGGGDTASNGLSRMLPTEVGGVTLEVTSMSGEEFMADADPEFDALLDRLGRSASDVSGATAFGFDTESGASVFIFAIRIAGANTDQLRDEFQAAMEAESETPVETDEVSLGGKDVVRAQTDSEDPVSALSYLYATGDVLFLVGASDEELAAEALGDLP